MLSVSGKFPTVWHRLQELAPFALQMPRTWQVLLDEGVVAQMFGEPDGVCVQNIFLADISHIFFYFMNIYQIENLKNK